MVASMPSATAKRRAIGIIRISQKKGYAIGERSSRAIEQRCREDVAFRVICANRAPDPTDPSAHDHERGGLPRPLIR